MASGVGRDGETDVEKVLKINSRQIQTRAGCLADHYM